jgi:2-oxoglutarate ferredoxin oxidoreductase subunit alpha
VAKAAIPPGKYRRITGNEAVAMGMVTAAQLASKDLVYATYPITPASDILHNLAMLKQFGVKTIQAEDEIAAICAAIGASYAGQLGATGTSGPGLCLKSEALNLAVMAELPLVVINVQRGGPSTGLPTKVEQSDLLQALYGRNGDSPVVVISPRSPSDCFNAAIEAVRISVYSMVPVILLSDGYVANGAEPWLIPDPDTFEKIDIGKLPEIANEADGFQPYRRNQRLARPWAAPGTAGYEHRIGGLEKHDLTGNVSYLPENHQKMTELRKGKVDRIAEDIPPLEVEGPESGELLLLGWGGTYGAISTAATQAREAGQPVASAHLRYLNPMPANTEQVLRSYDRVLIPELNTGQLRLLIRGKYLVDARGLNKVAGQPFLIDEIRQAIDLMLSGDWGDAVAIGPHRHDVKTDNVMA